MDPGIMKEIAIRQQGEVYAAAATDRLARRRRGERDAAPAPLQASGSAAAIPAAAAAAAAAAVTVPAAAAVTRRSRWVRRVRRLGRGGWAVA
jgi:hypothetical protein